MRNCKPLGGKTYGSIGHLPGSMMIDRKDKGLHEGQVRIATVKTRDKHDRVIVQEKLDGSCVAVAKVDGMLIPLTKSGYHASTSPFKQHFVFVDWVLSNSDRFHHVINNGERIVGEWLYQAHGTRYELEHEPFVAFDIIKNGKRLDYSTFKLNLLCLFETPYVLHNDNESCSIEKAIQKLGMYGHHGAVDFAEGVVYRVERKGVVDFLGKYVRNKQSDVGRYLKDEKGNQQEILNKVLDYDFTSHAGFSKNWWSSQGW